MEKIWLKNYPKGVPSEINPSTYSSLVELIEQSFGKYPEKIAFSNMDVTLSFDETQKLSLQFASYLQNELRLKKGDRIAIQMPNLLQYPVVLFGALMAGVIIVNTNPLYTPREMEHQFKDSEVTTIVILANFASKLQEILPRTKIKNIIISELGDFFPTPKRVLTNFVIKHIKKLVPAFSLKSTSLKDALAIGAKTSFRKVAINHEDLAFLQYTGGTTGVSKGAMLTHRNMVANVIQMTEWLKSELTAGQEVILAALPLYHIFSLTVNCIGLFKEGMTNVLVTNPRDIPALTKEIKKTHPTVIIAVNTLLSAMLENPDFRALKQPRLKFAVAGGMSLKTSVAKRWTEITGTQAFEGYGLTECSPVVSVNPLNSSARIGTIGLPVSSTDVDFRNEDGKSVTRGEVGEIWVKGPQVMKGYLNSPTETNNIITSDGWLKTGDLGKMDEDGFIQIVDRKKDMILVSGFNVYPNEIEEVLAHHPGVLEVAAIGVDDEHSGEVVKVVIVKRDPALTEEAVREFAKKDLTSYKVPKYVEFRKELPKNNVGKVLRRLLKDEKAKT